MTQKARKPKAKTTSRLRPEPNGSGEMKFTVTLSSLEIDPKELHADSIADHVWCTVEDYVRSKSQNPESYVITVEEV